VLVAQVQVGGVGLNIQAASVVVLCEPQLKPTTEAQAIARVHRMGQVHTVRGHRLLVEGSVDERIMDILAEKQQLFDAYVRDSSLADRAVGAVDVTEARLARQVVAFEQARLGFGPVWEGLAAEGRLGDD
jgi:SNF2 family DNA or RNA helicase